MVSPSTLLFLGGSLWLASIYASAAIHRKSLLRLSSEEKVRLVDVAASGSRLSAIVLAIVLAGSFACIYVLPGAAWQVVTAALAAILLLGSTSSVVSYRRLKAAKLPDHFLRAFKISRVLRFGAAALLFAAAIAGVYSYHSARAQPFPRMNNTGPVADASLTD